MDQVIQEVEPLTRQVKARAQVTQLVGAVLEHRRRMAALLGGVFSMTPGAVALEGLTFERSRNELVLRGQAPSTQQVLAYIQALKGLERVEEVRLKYSTAHRSSAGERINFELAMVVRD